MLSADIVLKRIAEVLLVDYSSIYYVDAITNEYYWYSVDQDFNSLHLEPKGEDFFVNLKRDAQKVVFSEDLPIFMMVEKEKLMEDLKKGIMTSVIYRLVIDGKPVYHELRVIHEGDSEENYFILGIKNIDEEYRKEEEKKRLEKEKENFDRLEEERLNALNTAKELARRDMLTGVKNNVAYQELEESIEVEITARNCSPFALVVCDINDLKIMNDTKGHKAGDELIRSACRLICTVFDHSPVFRVGGDEFVVLLQGMDYDERDDLMNMIRNQVLENLNLGEGPVVATGMSEYIPGNDSRISDVFVRADALMYENKKDLKEKKILKETYAMKNEEIRLMPEERKQRLDSLFKSFVAVAEGTYVYICDMKYDFSRWSKSAVDNFGLPSEYMYHAGDIWEERIHPEDRGIYRLGIADIFAGNSGSHDMQYRALRVSGDYEVCTCKGFVIKDLFGKPEYFAGAIRNHGLQGNIDVLTGFPNQYAFFEDIRGRIAKKRESVIFLTGISKISEINEVYGYEFGNEVIQKFSRKLHDAVGNTGFTYRLDGTKMAAITSVYDTQRIMIEYEKLRHFCRGSFYVQDRCIPIELNAAVLPLDSFDIDYKTVYTCLNFAYDESKHNRRGDLVEFYNGLNDNNRQRIEKLHAIRSSIMHDFEGFYLLYQPVVDAETEKITAAEALLRWKNEEYGVVLPDLFIPMLEQDAQFPLLGEWILKNAMTDALEIMKDYPDFIVHVNLSYTQIEKPDFADMVHGLLDELHFPANHLCLELTERCRTLNMEILKNAGVNLKGRGVLLALDDFGTGYASVSIMKHLAMDIIKVDRSFVMNIEEDDKERMLISHFASLAGIMDAEVCIEGIETAGMRDILRTCDVQSFQGYFYSKPVMLEDLKQYIKDNLASV